MMTRREAIGVLSAMSAGTWLAARWRQAPATPPLAPGAPMSAQRRALVDAFKEQSQGLDATFEARTFAGDWAMPYRLFRPAASGALPLVLYLHGGGGLGNDNQKQMGLGNVFGTRVWALPEHQREFPCYVLVPQTDRGWVNYAPPAPGDSVAHIVPGLGEGARMAVEIVTALRREFAIDERRLYVTGQSMGGAGVWHLTAQRPDLFAAAVPCCASPTLERAVQSVRTPVWNFHGDADQIVPVAVSRERITALRQAGGHPLATEYQGVGHNVWEWAYTEAELVRWVFAQRRAA